MATKKITDLTELTSAASGDVLPIVDVDVDITKKITTANMPISTATQTALDAKQDILVSATNIKTINSTSLLGSGDISIEANPSGGAGAIQFSDGSAFASDSNLFWDNTNKQIQIGGSDSTGTKGSGIRLRPNLPTSSIFGADIFSYYNNDKWLQISKGNTNYYTFADSGLGMNLGQFGIPTARLHVKSSGSTSATTSLLVQNSSGTELLKVRDDGTINLRSKVSVNHPTVSTRELKLEWGSIYATDTGSELVLGAVYSISSSPQILLAGTSRATGSNTMQLQASSGVSIAESVTTPNASAQLDVSSTTRGFLPPRMTTTQKNAISSPASGLIVYDTTTNKLCCYNGTSWNDLF